MRESDSFCQPFHRQRERIWFRRRLFHVCFYAICLRKREGEKEELKLHFASICSPSSSHHLSLRECGIDFADARWNLPKKKNVSRKSQEKKAEREIARTKGITVSEIHVKINTILRNPSERQMPSILCTCMCMSLSQFNTKSQTTPTTQHQCVCIRFGIIWMASMMDNENIKNEPERIKNECNGNTTAHSGNNNSTNKKNVSFSPSLSFIRRRYTLCACDAIGEMNAWEIIFLSLRICFFIIIRWYNAYTLHTHTNHCVRHSWSNQRQVQVHVCVCVRVCLRKIIPIVFATVLPVEHSIRCTRTETETAWTARTKMVNEKTEKMTQKEKRRKNHSLPISQCCVLRLCSLCWCVFHVNLWSFRLLYCTIDVNL